MPQPRRFAELGMAIRMLVESWPSDLRVAIIGTGHLSLELGGPRQFGPHGPDPEFDRKAVEWIATVSMPISLQARWMRRAISPRFAISTFLNIVVPVPALIPG